MTGEGLPVLFGDLLVSRPSDGGETKFRTPTVGEISKAGEGLKPTGLCQKLTVINDGLAVGWAGSRWAAAAVVQHLFEEIGDRETNLAELAQFFTDLDPAEKRGLQVVGLVREGNTIGSFDLGASRFSSPIGNVRVAGSGANDLKSYIDNCEPFSYSDSFNPLLKTIGSALGMTGYTLGREFTNLDSLMNKLYGAGFEVVSYEGGKLQKIGDLTYLFWNAQQDEKGWAISLPIAAINFSYRADLLLIRVIRLESQSAAKPSILCREHEMYPVAPVFRRWTNNDLKLARERPLPSFNARVICNIINVVDNRMRSSVFSKMVYGDQASKSIKFVENDEGGVSGVDFSGDFLHELASSISRRHLPIPQ